MLYTLQNEHWQVGILPETGGSIAFGRIRYSGAWVDVMRPTDEADYGNSSKTSSFLMLPWANRIRDGVLRYQEQEYQLETTPEDGTARHGDVRKRVWSVVDHTETYIRMNLRSASFADFNFPFRFTASLEFRLEDNDFVWQVSLTNEDDRVMPAGFGFHPYFVHPAENMPLVHIPCDQQFIIEDGMASDPPVPIRGEVDLRTPRAITPSMKFDHLLTHRADEEPTRLIYEDWNLELQMIADPMFKHVLVFTAPDGTLAIEPQTNANDGFNLHARGIEAAGILELHPQERITGEVKLSLQKHVE